MKREQTNRVELVLEMMRLLIIADDFTGALDTGVQFAAHGAATRVIVGSAFDPKYAATEAQVLVLDAETRRRPPEEAYEAVRRIAASAREAGFPFIYKKTDSGLRGNIGAELAAAMDGAEVSALPFIPAFPAMNRVTREGVHYVEGLPVAQSVFGRDPFEPVRFSDVRSIIAQQTDKPVAVVGPGQPPPAGGIGVYDAESEEDLRRIARDLGRERLRLSAGCAGFASALAELLELRGAPPRLPALPPALFMVCGSVNPVTREQVARAVKAGFTRVWKGDAPEEVSRRMILDANQQLTAIDVLEEQDRLRVSAELAAAAKGFLDRGLDATLMCVGGDTLLALMRAVGVSELTPVRELDKGVVLTSFCYNQKEYYMMTKSGGFGGPDLLCRLAEKLEA